MSRSRPSVMKHQWATTPTANIPRSSFDRSHGYKTTFDAGRLIPFFVDEVLPGDTFNLRVHALARLATPLKPIMDNLMMDTHFFFVPYRQIWQNFRKFMGEQVNPGDSIEYTVPIRNTSSPQEQSLYDYMGIPTKKGATPHNVLPMRAYYHIFNEWFRDQNLVNSLSFPTDDGPDDAISYSVRNRGKRHDYFTSALPFPQKGEPVLLPLGQEAPVLVDSAFAIPGSPVAYVGDNGNVYGQQVTTTSVDWNAGVNPADPDDQHLYADLSTATASTINEIREAFQIQKLLERDARGGTRYAEIVRSHFGVDFYDVSYRPVYLGGGSSPVNITPIAQTGGSGVDQSIIATPQANLAAMGTTVLRNHGFTQSFTEHGVVIGLVSVRADLTYQQGLERFWNRRTRYDFYWPALAHLGEQEVLSGEIYFDAADGDLNASVFGYQERYAEYRYKPSKVTGLFRSNADQSLDFWHLSQEFTERPQLNSTFIQEDPPIDRVIAVPTEPHFLFDAYINLRCARPMPVRAIPGLVDHF